jgi:histidinol-phosphate aminotransferase
MNIDFISSKAANFVTFSLGEKADMVMQKLMKRSIAVASLAGYNMLDKLRVTVGLPQQNTSFIENLEDILRL